MPIHPVSRVYVTRAAVVATTSAAAALLTVLPAVGATAPPITPAVAAAPSTATTPAALFRTATAPVPAIPVVPAPVVPAPVVPAPVENVALAAPMNAGQTAVTNALGKVGAPYKWGGNGPSSFDCSGLVNWAFESTGVELPRTSRALSQVGTPVSQDNLQPGDLVFFYSPVSHVGIYIGDGQMVHASNSRKPVAVDPIAGREFHSARRV